MEIVQRDITQSMRGILVDWLVEVCNALVTQMFVIYQSTLCMFLLKGTGVGNKTVTSIENELSYQIGGLLN